MRLGLSSEWEAYSLILELPHISSHSQRVIADNCQLLGVDTKDACDKHRVEEFNNGFVDSGAETVVFGIDNSDLGVKSLEESKRAAVHRTGRAVAHKKQIRNILIYQFERSVEELACVEGT